MGAKDSKTSSNNTTPIYHNSNSNELRLFSKTVNKSFIISQNGVLGSLQDCQISVQDKRISKKQVQFFFLENEGFFMKDLGSTNGTFIHLENSFVLAFRRNMQFILEKILYTVSQINNDDIHFEYSEEGNVNQEWKELIICFCNHEIIVKCMKNSEENQQEIVKHKNICNYLERIKKWQFSLKSQLNLR